MLLVNVVGLIAACRGAPTPSAAPLSDAEQFVPTKPAPAANVPPEVERSPDAGQSVAGLALETPAQCRLELEPPRGGSIHCPSAILTWLNGTGNDLDELAAQVESNGFPILERTSIGCRIGELDGEGDVLMVEHQGARFPVFVCVIPYEQAYTAVRCTGYDPRAMPTDDAPVPEPCDQVITHQPVLVGLDLP